MTKFEKASSITRRQADMNRASSLNPIVRDATLSVADNRLSADLAERLAAAGASGAMEAQQALALYAAAGAPGAGRVRSAFAGFDIGPAKANQARMLELDAVSTRGAKGDTALLALWLMMDAGDAGPTPADRARITRAINVAGFAEDHLAITNGLSLVLGVRQDHYHINRYDSQLLATTISDTFDIVAAKYRNGARMNDSGRQTAFSE